VARETSVSMDALPVYVCAIILSARHPYPSHLSGSPSGGVIIRGAAVEGQVDHGHSCAPGFTAIGGAEDLALCSMRHRSRQ